MATQELKADSVTAKRFRLVGDNGELRALMKTKDGNPILEFFDHSSQVRLNVQVSNDWPILNMMDQSGNVCVELGAVNSKPALFLKDQIGNLRVGIALSKIDGSPRIVFLDDQRNVRFGVVTDTEGIPRIIATDQFGSKHEVMWFGEPADERDMEDI
jgi:hypothetical protein